jgi:hypothetical protein
LVKGEGDNIINSFINKRNNYDNNGKIAKEGKIGDLERCDRAIGIIKMD